MLIIPSEQVHHVLSGKQLTTSIRIRNDNEHYDAEHTTYDIKGMYVDKVHPCVKSIQIQQGFANTLQWHREDLGNPLKNVLPSRLVSTDIYPMSKAYYCISNIIVRWDLEALEQHPSVYEKSVMEERVEYGEYVEVCDDRDELHWGRLVNRVPQETKKQCIDVYTPEIRFETVAPDEPRKAEASFIQFWQEITHLEDPYCSRLIADFDGYIDNITGRAWAKNKIMFAEGLAGVTHLF